jgi:non-ribosomal peptide synthetase component F
MDERQPLVAHESAQETADELATEARGVDVQPCSEVLAPAERRRLLHDFNDTAVPFPVSTLIQLFEQQVAKSPNNIALVFPGQELTYAELDARSNQLAWRLIADGIGPEDIVAICLDRSPEMIVAILATLKAGAAYLPLDPGYPPERLAFITKDARPKRILTTLGLDGILPHVPPGVCLHVDAPEVNADLSRFPLAAPTDVDRATPLRPHHPAYLIYTSGSTGIPKGVAVTNLAISNSIQARLHFYNTDIEALNYLAPISFDISVAQIFWTFSRGAKLVVALVPAVESLNDEGGRNLQKSITHLMLSSSVYANLLMSGGGENWRGLRCVVVGGDALPSQTVRLHRSIHEGVDLFNEYGPTEAAIWSTAGRCDDDPEGSTPSIGAPIP